MQYLLQLYLLRKSQGISVTETGIPHKCALFPVVPIALFNMKSVKSYGTAFPQKMNSFPYGHIV